MSIATEITRLQQDKTAIAAAIAAKGVSTTGHGMDDFATDIAAIPSGGADERVEYLTKGGTLSGDCVVDLSDITLGQWNKILRPYLFYRHSSSSSREKITGIRFPANMEEIGAYAFYQQGLKTVTIPAAVQSISENAFRKCTDLTSVTFDTGSALYRLESSIFAECTALTTCVLPDTVATMMTDTFSGCSSLTTAAIPSQITKINERTFKGCSSLAWTSLPDTITTIKTQAFMGCSSLALTSLPSNLTSMETYAFQDCSSLAITTVPSGITSIPTSCFYGTGITELELPATVNMVDPSAFSNCPNLTTLRLGAKGIQSYIFQNCYKLENVWISSDCTSMTATAYTVAPFRNCTKLTDIYCEAESKPSGWGAYWNYKDRNVQATVHWGVSRADFEAMINQ